ncbi:MAG: hypothetical protein HN849_19730 [Victivallales bacterium]|nr:hypothetical protein [Victivallales bacterium]
MTRNHFSLAHRHNTGSLIARLVVAFAAACLASTGALAYSIARRAVGGDLAYFLPSRRKACNIGYAALRMIASVQPPQHLPEYAMWMQDSEHPSGSAARCCPPRPDSAWSSWDM